MKPRKILVIACMGILLAAGSYLLSCSTVNDQKAAESGVVTIPIRVFTDEYYGYNKNVGIGIAMFAPAQGLVGAKVEGESFVQVIGKFTNSQLKAKLFLMNKDAASNEFAPVDFLQNGAERRFSFIIPSVYTVPSILNFRLLLYEYREEGDDDTSADDDSAQDDDSTADDDTIADDDTTQDDDTVSDDDSGVKGNLGTDDDSAENNGKTIDTGLQNKGFEAAADFSYIVNRGGPAL